MVSNAECRLCLVNNVRMHTIQSTRYPDIFEKLTGSKLMMDGRMPDTICYVCGSMLQKFDKFFNMALNAELVLTQRLFDSIEPLQITRERGVTFHNLSRSSVRCVSNLDADSDHDFTEVAVKVEPMDDEEFELVKQEYEETLPLSDVYNARGSPTHILSTPDIYHPEEITEYDSIPPDICLKDDLDASEDKENLRHLTSDVANLPIDINEFLKEFSNIAERTLSNTDVKNIKLKCSMCKFKCISVDELVTHVTVHDHDYAFPCDKVTRRSSLCPICMKQFRNRISLKVHMRLHTGQQPYECSSCDRVFNQKQNLQIHMRMHDRKEQFTCGICTAKIPLKADYNRHMLSHGINLYDFKTLRRRYQSKIAALKRKPVACNICGKEFQKNYYLKRHLRLHTGDQPYSCESCERVFNQKNNLLIHLQTHNNKKQYTCEMCFKKFPLKQDMKRHMARHIDEVIFERDFELFHQENVFVLHLRYHTGQLTPYPCELCKENYIVVKSEC